MQQIERMMSGDLDPVFVKALKLLQSRSKDSYFQLRQMYDDVVAQRKAEAVIKRVTHATYSWLPALLSFITYLAYSISLHVRSRILMAIAICMALTFMLLVFIEMMVCTWKTAASTLRTLLVGSTCGPLAAVSCLCRDTAVWCSVVGPFLWPARWPGTRYQTTFKIRRVLLTVFVVTWKLFFSRSTCVHIALGALWLCTV